jgi:hypothetical protein
MKTPLLFWLCLPVLLVAAPLCCPAGIATEPWPTKIMDFPTEKDAVTIQGFKITVRSSNDQTGAGTGGTMVDITVENLRTGAKRTEQEQTDGVAILQFYHGWPQFELWGRGGGGSFSRSLYRFTGKDYEYVRTDEFTAYDSEAKDKNRTAVRAGDDEKTLLYFVETRIP